MDELEITAVLLHGLSEKRCPECGRPVPPVCGFGLVAVPVLLLFGIKLIEVIGGKYGQQEVATLQMLGFFLALYLSPAPVTWLLWLLVGYIVYRKKRS